MTSSVSSNSSGNCHAEPVDVSSEALAKEEASRRRRYFHLGNTPLMVEKVLETHAMFDPNQLFFFFYLNPELSSLLFPDPFIKGAWRNWLAHQTVDLVVAGSSPVAPAIFAKDNGTFQKTSPNFPQVCDSTTNFDRISLSQIAEEPSALCATCCAANGCISTCRQFTPRLGAGRPRPERTAEDRRLHKRLQSTTLHHSKLGPQNGLHRRKLSEAPA